MDTGGDSGSEEDEGLSLKGNGKKKKYQTMMTQRRVG